MSIYLSIKPDSFTKRDALKRITKLYFKFTVPSQYKSYPSKHKRNTDRRLTIINASLDKRLVFAGLK